MTPRSDGRQTTGHLTVFVVCGFEFLIAGTKVRSWDPLFVFGAFLLVVALEAALRLPARLHEMLTRLQRRGSLPLENPTSRRSSTISSHEPSRARNPAAPADDTGVSSSVVCKSGSVDEAGPSRRSTSS